MPVSVASSSSPALVRAPNQKYSNLRRPPLRFSSSSPHHFSHTMAGRVAGRGEVTLMVMGFTAGGGGGVGVATGVGAGVGVAAGGGVGAGVGLAPAQAPATRGKKRRSAMMPNRSSRERVPVFILLPFWGD